MLAAMSLSCSNRMGSMPSLRDRRVRSNRRATRDTTTTVVLAPERLAVSRKARLLPVLVARISRTSGALFTTSGSTHSCSGHLHLSLLFPYSLRNAANRARPPQ
jgi:hypothetical protein